MVLDPVSTIGLAANILQFIDFSCGIIRDAKEMYRSNHGSKSGLVELQGVAESLARLSSTFIEDSPVESADVKQSAKREIHTLAALCKAIADELIATIQSLQVREGSHRKWQSFRQALNTVWKKDKIVSLEKRLEMARSHLSSHILSHISSRQNEVLRSLETIRDECHRANLSQSERIDPMLESLRTLLGKSHDFDEQLLASVDQKLLGASQEAIRLHKELSILKSLKFDRMTARHSAIVEAHVNTFDWIFEPSRLPLSDPRSQVRFHEWLTHGEDIYWISGKPGSGKSTFAKYLYNSWQTRQCLRVWAKDARLATAGFFFWISGAEMQKSQRGLLQQLLFEVLRTFPDLISLAFPERWASSQSMIETEWPLSELSEAFRRLSVATQDPATSAKLCIFVDGMDEYSGDHLDLIKTVQDIAKLKNIKMCVSSRPWNCFEDAFGRDKHLKLYLQDLTMTDIAIYARDKLEEVSRSSMFDADGSQFEHFISEIVQRAQGVFLWVFLVARSLRQGLVNGDSLSLLQERLLEMPTDLEAFFEKIIQSVDKVYQRRMAHTFQIALVAHKPLRLILYSFIAEASTLPWRQPRNRMREEMLRIEELMNRQLNGRYKGLLESHGDPGAKHVDFLHRTVRDFLATKGMQDFFVSLSEPEFNAAVYVCEAFIRQAEVFHDSLFSTDLDDFLFFAQKAEETLGTHSTALLEGMNHVCYSQSSPVRDSFNCTGTQAISLLGKAIELGFTTYVRERLDHDPTLVAGDRHQTLFLALKRWFSSTAIRGRELGADNPPPMALHDVYGQRNSRLIESTYEMAALLLEHGVDANSTVNERPILHILLDSFPPESYHHLDAEVFQWYCRLLLLFLSRGAEFHQELVNDNCCLWKYLFDTEFDDQIAEQILRLFSLLLHRGLRPDTYIGAKMTLWAVLIYDMNDDDTTYQTTEFGMQPFCLEMLKLFLRKGAKVRFSGGKYIVDTESCGKPEHSFEHYGVPRAAGSTILLDDRISADRISAGFYQQIFTPGSVQYREVLIALEAAVGTDQIPRDSKPSKRSYFSGHDLWPAPHSPKRRSYSKSEQRSRKRYRGRNGLPHPSTQKPSQPGFRGARGGRSVKKESW
ncbi:hypothetical protein H2200_000672 [Cladophialophora chaetospira]|uniref:NACHT domain-containing protein n=1 Tax=Cladophialophora chaetospira TaxID=386627 RepID=A0AA38XP03_9EURO|nr:hypothetical protein H2200_000672 [Cladophialophora chaetospira]